MALSDWVGSTLVDCISTLKHPSWQLFKEGRWLYWSSVLLNSNVRTSVLQLYIKTLHVPGTRMKLGPRTVRHRNNQITQRIDTTRCCWECKLKRKNTKGGRHANGLQFLVYSTFWLLVDFDLFPDNWMYSTERIAHNNFSCGYRERRRAVSKFTHRDSNS